MADHDVLGILITASLVRTNQVGVGASAGVNQVTNTTRAFIGNLEASALPVTSQVSAGRDVKVEATSDERFFAVSVAGTVATTADTTPASGRDGPIQIGAHRTGAVGTTPPPGGGTTPTPAQQV